MSLNIKDGFGPLEHFDSSSANPVKTVDVAKRFLNPVLLTDSTGSEAGISGNPLIVTGSLGDVTLSISDIEIGAVELKNRDSDDRAIINASGELHVVNSPSSASINAYSFYNSIVYESGSLIKQSAGILYRIHGYSSYTGSQFIQVHNTIAEPADAAVPVIIKTVSSSSNFDFSFGRFGIPFDTGITIMTSTTGPTMTSGSQNCWFNIEFK